MVLNFTYLAAVRQRIAKSRVCRAQHWGQAFAAMRVHARPGDFSLAIEASASTYLTMARLHF